MPWVLGVCLLVFALAMPPGAAAGEGLLEPFDPEGLTETETRLLQAALAAAGDYSGPLDGAWGAGSQAALDTWSAREHVDTARNLHAGALVLGFLDAVTLDGWDFRPLPSTGVSLALPFDRLGPPEPEEGGERRWSRDGSLTVLVHRFDAAQTEAWHAAARRANARPGAGASRREPHLLITAGELRDGRDFYTRSDLTADGWTTVYLASGADDAARMNLAAASVRPGPPLPWELPEHGRLAALVDEAAALLDAGLDPLPVLAPPGAAALPRGGEIGPGATGTGFYLGPSTLVTAAHVVAGCSRVALADGSALALVAADAELDVAVLEAPRRARTWLTLADGTARLGQRVHAAGFPYYAIAGTSLHLTSGNVSSLAGIDDDQRFFSFSAPVQPGNSGGPLIDGTGAVLGLIVARLSEEFIVEATGTLPQNVNYALAEPELAGFLGESGVAAVPGGLGGFAIDEGAPSDFAAAVVPLICE